MERSPYVIRKKERLGKRVDYDKAYGYQCVDLFKLYCHAVLGIRYTAKTGNANEIRENKYNIFNKARTRIIGYSDLKQGDVVFFAFGEYWHVGIIDTIDSDKRMAGVLEQNGSGKNSGNGLGDNAIRVKYYSLNKIVGVRRHALVDDMLAKEYYYIDTKFKTQGYEDDQTTIYKYSLQYKK